jgi:hypothetical protein
MIILNNRRFPVKDYKKMMGVKNHKVMKDHGNVSSIKADVQDYDMNRCKKRGMERKGNSDMAFSYKY